MRKGISKKIRFEVFKRDSFKCQYCGKSAPEAVLEIDHINPVCEGGNNDLFNLITACFDCNRGKGKRPLSDKTTISKQKNDLDKLNERRNQLEMVIKWKEEISNISNTEVEYICNTYQDSCLFSVSDHGKKIIKRIIKKYGLSEVYNSLEISIDQYYKNTQESSIKVFDFIEKIAKNRKLHTDKPYLKDMYYIRRVLNNRFYFSKYEFLSIINDLEKAYFALDENSEDLKRITLDNETREDYNEIIDCILERGEYNNG